MAAPIPPQTADEPRRITRLYIVALTVIAALSVSGQVLIQQQIERQHADAKVINLAGRQRMLSQRICKCALVLASAGLWRAEDEAAIRHELRMTLDQWRRCHEGLQFGDRALGIPGRLSAAAIARFQTIDDSFRQLSESAGRLCDKRLSHESRIAAATLIRAREGAFLSGMDAVVSQLEREANGRVERLRSIEWALFVCMLGALAVEGLFVFRPAVARVRTTIQALRAASLELLIAKEAAETADRAKSQFLTKVSHELRTPLHAVRGASELLRRRPADATSREYLQIIDESAQALAALVEDLLDVSTMDVEAIRLAQEPFDLPAMLARAIRIVGPQAQAKGLATSVVVSPAVPRRVVGDEFRLQQVLLNLLANAVQFTEQGRITLRASVVDRGPPTLREPSTSSLVHLEVSDTGMGIPEDCQQIIFEKFAQVDPSSRRHTGGIGLGLAIAAQLVMLMRGRLRVSSQPGQGSTFWCELPLDHAGGENLTLAPAGDVGAKLRVLAADDTDHSRRILRAMLESLGHEVTMVADGQAAFRCFCRNTYDVVLLDMQMPEWDGQQTALAIHDHQHRLHQRATPVMLVSASAQPSGGALDLFIDCLIKPVSRQSLAMALARIVPTNRLSTNASPLPAAIAGNASLAIASAHPNESALQRLGGDRQLFDDLLQTFFGGLPEQMKQLQTAVHEGSPQAGVIAHRLHGQLITFDFFPAATAAKAIEECVARSGDVATAVRELEAEVNRL